MNRWDVYWAEVPFEEDPSQRKTRPVIIANDKVAYVLKHLTIPAKMTRTIIRFRNGNLQV